VAVAGTAGLVQMPVGNGADARFARSLACVSTMLVTMLKDE